MNIRSAVYIGLLGVDHARSRLKVMVDMVLAHTSDQHPWFQESRQSRTNPKADWYVWADAKPDGTPPNNWLSAFSGPSWHWEPRRRQYYLHHYLAAQPNLDWHNPAVINAMLGEVADVDSIDATARYTQGEDALHTGYTFATVLWSLLRIGRLDFLSWGFGHWWNRGFIANGSAEAARHQQNNSVRLIEERMPIRSRFFSNHASARLRP